MNEDIIKDIKHFEYVTKNRYEVMEKLLEKNYPENDLITEFDNYQFKKEWNGNILGFLMICLAVFIGFNIESTFGSFDYEFDSSGDFYRLNEWVFKPFLILSLMFSGINSIIDRGYLNKNLKLIMILAFTFFIITSFASNSAMSLLIGIIGFIIFVIYKTPSESNISNSRIIIDDIQARNRNQKSILRKINSREGKIWKGSSIFVFLLLAFSLFLNSPIDLTREIVNKTGNSTYYKTSLENIDVILLYGLKTLLGLSFFIAIFLNINLRKFKILLFLIVAICLIYIIATFFHSNFQNSIFPALIIAISGIIVIIKNKLLKNNTNKQSKIQ